MRFIFLILSVCIFAGVAAQEVPLNTEQQLENLSEEAIEDDALLQQLLYYQKHPLNLNAATVEDLYMIRQLTSLQIQNFIRYRSVFGKLLSIYELQAVPGFDESTIKKLLPFVFVGSSQTAEETFASRLSGGSRFALLRFSRTMEKSKGYDRTLRTHYLGDPNHLQFRYTFQFKNLLYYGLLADKDAGEQFFRGAQKAGFDFYSIHFFVRNLGKIKALALGDYTINLGQGLTQWQTLAFGKSADVMNIKRQAPVLLPYRSAGEFLFNRGAAATLQLGALQATLFASIKKFSGNINVDSVKSFTSFGTSGLYRTHLEAEERYKLSHFSSGANLSYNKTNWKIGVNAVMHHFSLPLQKRDEPYNRFALAGSSFFLSSMDYSYTHKNAHFFGEIAIDPSFHKAVVQGALFSVDTKVDFSLLYRNIAKEFQSPFGNAFTENTLPSNEKGFYTGIQIRPSSQWQLAGYADFYQSPFLKYRVSAPSRGWDYLVQATHVPNKHTEVYVRYRTESKPLNGTGGVLNHPDELIKQNLRLHFLKRINKKTTLKGRAEVSFIEKKNKNSERGFLSFLEVGYEPIPKLNGNIRIQYFGTDSYNSRIYAYESDVLYSFSTPAFFDKGFRNYLNISYVASKRLSYWIRLAQTVFLDKGAIGSGLDEIKHSHKTEMRLQAKITF